MSRKELEVDYADRSMKISIPGDALVVEGQAPRPIADPEKAIRRAIENPVGMKRPRECVTKNSKVVIAFDNFHRPGLPRRLIIPILLEELRAGGVDERNVTLVCAGGACAKATRQQLLNLLGPDIFHRFWPYRLVNHDASEHVTCLGTTDSGGYAEINSLFAEADFSAYLGTVLPLCWAGLSGTGVVIGLGSARCITSNHSFDVIGSPDSFFSDPSTMKCRKHKESIHRKIEEGMGKQVFYVDVLNDSSGRIAACVAGHSPEINREIWPLAESVYTVKVPQADVMIVGIPHGSVYGDTSNPLIATVLVTTVSRYAINNHLIREGGVIIGVTDCDGTIDDRYRPSDREVIERFGQCYSPSELVDAEESFMHRSDYLERYRHAYAFHPVHPFWLFYECQYMMQHASRIIFAGAKNPEAVRTMGCTPARDFDTAWKMAEDVVGKDARAVVFPTFWSKGRALIDVR